MLLYILTGNICGVRFSTILNKVINSDATSTGISSTVITFVTKSSIMEFVIHPVLLIQKIIKCVKI